METFSLFVPVFATRRSSLEMGGEQGIEHFHNPVSRDWTLSWDFVLGLDFVHELSYEGRAVGKPQSGGCEVADRTAPIRGQSQEAGRGF